MFPFIQIVEYFQNLRQKQQIKSPLMATGFWLQKFCKGLQFISRNVFAHPIQFPSARFRANIFYIYKQKMFRERKMFIFIL